MQEQEKATTKLVVGLGNPGRRYEKTRHNVGFAVVDALVARWNAAPGRSAFDGRVFDARFQAGDAERRVLMLQPHTYMNCSGAAVTQMAAFYKVACQDVLIVLDDMALPTGQLRFRAAGSSGGHKGLEDVLAAMGTDEVPRLRIGIGTPPGLPRRRPGEPDQMDATDFVLTPFNDDELETIQQAVASAAQAVEEWAVKGMTAVMEKYNRKGAGTD